MADQPAFTLVSIHGAASAGDRIWEGRKKSSDLFANYRAEMYWSLRRRFEKTFERVELGYNHLDEECISIPNNATLIAQLSMPRSKPRPDGKILIESKHDMRRRGVSSPDYADSLAYAFAPTLSAAKRKIVVL